MPINVFGSTSQNVENIIHTSSLVRKPHLRTNFTESNTEEDIGIKKQFKVKTLTTPIDPHQATPKSYVYNKLNDFYLKRNSANVDLNDKNLDDVRFVKVKICLLSENT